MKPVDFQSKRINQFKHPHQVEEPFVTEFFNHKSSGMYVEVGANEPINLSQTWHLEQKGWRGLLIEPIPQYCDMLRKQRKGTVVQYACSSPQNHNQVLKLIVAGGHSTLNNQPIARGTQSEETVEVTCRTLDSIFEENGVPEGFDFLSIDIEGHEMEMFKGFTLPKWRPKLVLLEDYVVNHEKHNHMVANDYQLILRTGLNSWYVPADEPYTFSLASKLERFRKYWLGLWLRKLRFRNQLP